MFGLGRGAAVEARAKQIARMLVFIQHGMRTKTYEQFIESFSNPGQKPGALEQLDRKCAFIMRSVHVATGQTPGRDASAMMKALLRAPGWRSADAIERALLGM